MKAGNEVKQPRTESICLIPLVSGSSQASVWKRARPVGAVGGTLGRVPVGHFSGGELTFGAFGRLPDH